MATIVTVPSRTITGEFFSPSATIPVANQVSIKAIIADAVYFDPTKSFTLMFQFSTDGGTTWRDSNGGSWQGSATSHTDPAGNVDPRPTFSTTLEGLAGDKVRLHITTPTSIVMGATITYT